MPIPINVTLSASHCTALFPPPCNTPDTPLPITEYAMQVAIAMYPYSTRHEPIIRHVLEELDRPEVHARIMREAPWVLLE